MNRSLEFVSLGPEHASAIASYVEEFASAGEREINGYFRKPNWTHTETVAKLKAWSFGEELDGWVPSSTLFLISNDRILGNYNLRHELTDALMIYGGSCGYSVRPTERRNGYATKMLGHAKRLGKELGLGRMLLTCNPDNTGSVRTIEKNGGVLQDVAYNEDIGSDVARYWINLH